MLSVTYGGQHKGNDMNDAVCQKQNAREYGHKEGDDRKTYGFLLAGGTVSQGDCKEEPQQESDKSIEHDGVEDRYEVALKQVQRLPERVNVEHGSREQSVQGAKPFAEKQ